MRFASPVTFWKAFYIKSLPIHRTVFRVWEEEKNIKNAYLGCLLTRMSALRQMTENARPQKEATK